MKYNYLHIFLAFCVLASTATSADTATEPFEVVPADEAARISLIAAIQAKAQAAHPDLRGQHPKTNGCVEAVFTVRDDVPLAMRRGLFKVPGRYQAYIRYSNGGAADDRQPESLHGMAIKVVGVSGEKLVSAPGSSDAQDFVLVDNQVFFSENPLSLSKFMSAIGKAVQAANGGSPAEAKMRFMLDPANQRKYPEIPRILSLFQRDDTLNPLSTTYHSATPYLLAGEGEPFLVRYQAVPKRQTVDWLGEAMQRQLVGRSEPQSALYDFRVLRYTGATPEGRAEDPTQVWESSELTNVAVIEIPPQDPTQPERLRFCEQLAFSPWHSLAAHRPLGGINRARKPVYVASAATRKAGAALRPTGKPTGQ